MFDHVAITVSDFAHSKSFYARALAPAGYARLVELPEAPGAAPQIVGFCHQDGSDLWIRQGEPLRPPLHLAFRVASRAEVEAFYREAIAAGGRDHGAPGLRPHYHSNYYAAYVLDPDGHNLEVVCHEAP